MQQRLNELIERIRAFREVVGNRRVSLAEVEQEKPLDDGIGCGETVLVGFLAEQIIDGHIKADDFPWEDRHLRLLGHVSNCRLCLKLSLLEEGEPSPYYEQVVEQLKVSEKVPQEIRDMAVQAFGAPKGSQIH